jgi:transcriptional regulator with XRE-family HTH domain
MPRSGSPTVRRRRLAAELRRLRGGRTGEEIAGALRWSPSKLSRYELGRSVLKPGEVEKMLDFYGVVEPERGRLLSLAHDAAQKGWWEDYADVLSEEYRALIGLEAEATWMGYWQVELVPGPLQTERYAWQVHLGYQGVVPMPPRVMEGRVKVRMIRQELLTRDPPLELSVVLDESVLLRQFGDRSVMHAQLLQLARLAELPNITLKVMPLGVEHSIGVTSFQIFKFGSANETGPSMLHDVVSTESLNSEIYVEGDADTYLYGLVFENLSAESLSPSESRKLILQTAEMVWA